MKKKRKPNVSSFVHRKRKIHIIEYKVSPYRCIVCSVYWVLALSSEEAATSRFFGVDYINFLLIYARIIFKVIWLMHRASSKRGRWNCRNISMMTSDDSFFFPFFLVHMLNADGYLDEIEAVFDMNCIEQCIRYELYCILQ